jgi:hypothetical protein
MKVKIVLNDRGNPPGKLADAELLFTEGPLEGLKLIGFSVWERRRSPQDKDSYNVTFPARSYSVNGERRSFALLRPASGDAHLGPTDVIRGMIIAAYLEEAERETYPAGNSGEAAREV